MKDFWAVIACFAVILLLVVYVIEKSTGADNESCGKNGGVLVRGVRANICIDAKEIK